MILYKNRLIFGVVRKIISMAFTVVYKILSVFNLQLTLLVLLIGAVLYLTGTLDKNPTVLLIFQVVLICSVVYAIISTVKRLLGISKKPKKSKGAQILDTDASIDQTKVQEQAVQTVAVEQDKPTYFRVKQNPELIMAEYHDRYELFRVTKEGLKRIRTDYK
ncbi:MAG: hypothetical protein IJV95_02680 [Clostridia bacterium]|nr:hypothetical protein [Clostridia bacterium]